MKKKECGDIRRLDGGALDRSEGADIERTQGGHTWWWCGKKK